MTTYAQIEPTAKEIVDFLEAELVRLDQREANSPALSKKLSEIAQKTALVVFQVADCKHKLAIKLLATMMSEMVIRTMQFSPDE